MWVSVILQESAGSGTRFPLDELQEVPGVREVCLDCKLNPGKGYEIERRMDGFLNISPSLFFTS